MSTTEPCLLAKMIPDERGIVSRSQTTYAALHGVVPLHPRGGLDFDSVLHEPAPYNVRTYERVAMLMTGGFAD